MLPVPYALETTRSDLEVIAIVFTAVAGLLINTREIYQAEGSDVVSPLSLNTQDRDLLRNIGAFLRVKCT